MIIATKEPMFATASKHKRGVTMYFDKDNMPACMSLLLPWGRRCCICGNTCIHFKANEDGSYTCSACGKFPREVLIT